MKEEKRLKSFKGHKRNKFKLISLCSLCLFMPRNTNYKYLSLDMPAIAACRSFSYYRHMLQHVIADRVKNNPIIGIRQKNLPGYCEISCKLICVTMNENYKFKHNY